MKRIYLDHAATTYLDPEVKKAMEPFWLEYFGNPSSIYEEGRVAKRFLSEARAKVAQILNCHSDEIYFTAGGTESDNLAVLGVSRAYKTQGNHIIVSKIEHHAVLHSAEALEKEGFEVSYLDVDSEGIVNLTKLKEALKKETILVSIMYANNEIGTIQPIAEIGKIIRKFKKNLGRLNNSVSPPFFHTDAMQAAAYLDLNVEKLGVDLLSLNGSKIYGPKGIGALLKKRRIKIEPIIYGGQQENGLRAGTENIPAIIGFAKALELVQAHRLKESERLSKLRDYFFEGILKTIPKVIVNGSREQRLPNNVNVSFFGIEGEALVLYLDSKGIACSTGSACSSSSLEPSHVIMALGRDENYAHGSLRFSLGKVNNREDIDYVLKVLPPIVDKLRSFSALRLKNY